MLDEISTNIIENEAEVTIDDSYILTTNNTTITISVGTVNVYYVDIDTGEEIANTETYSDYTGKTYTTSSKEIEYYELIETSDNTEGTYSDDTINVYYYYELSKFDFSITKVNLSGETLEGAEFKLYVQICTDDHSSDLIGTGTYDENCWELVDTYTSGEDGVFTLEGLISKNTYRLVETKAPNGYVLPEGEWEFTFNTGTEEEIEITEKITLTVNGINNPLAMSYEDSTIYLYNEESYDIPTTGGLGTEDLFKIGISIIVIGSILCTYFYISTKRKFN